MNWRTDSSEATLAILPNSHANSFWRVCSPTH